MLKKYYLTPKECDFWGAAAKKAPYDNEGELINFWANLGKQYKFKPETVKCFLFAHRWDCFQAEPIEEDSKCTCDFCKEFKPIQCLILKQEVVALFNLPKKYKVACYDCTKKAKNLGLIESIPSERTDEIFTGKVEEVIERCPKCGIETAKASYSLKHNIVVLLSLNSVSSKLCSSCFKQAVIENLRRK